MVYVSRDPIRIGLHRASMDWQVARNFNHSLPKLLREAARFTTIHELPLLLVKQL